MAICNYCNSSYSDERLDAGYDYCMAEGCHKIGLDKRQRDFLKVYTPALLHKCNYFWIKKSELTSLNVRADLLVSNNYQEKENE